MEKFNPKVSIVIPVYNGSKYLGEAIDSALAQTYKNLEIIVSNDGSDDDGATEKVAKSYGDKIIYLGKKENGGASTALNAAIKVMTGEYFSWLSHDDMYYPNKIQRQVEELAKLEDKNTIMMSELDGIDENHNKIYQTNYMAHMNSYPARAESYIYPVVYNQTHGCTLLIPRDCFEKVGLFDVGERVAQDFEYFYRIFLKYPHKLVPEVLVTARDTSNRMGRRAKPRAVTEYSRLYIKILENLSDEDVRLMTKDKFTLLSDMWAFFKSAGYTPAYEYTSAKIIEYSQDFCVMQLKEYLSGKSSKVNLSETLKSIERQLGLVFDDDKQGSRYIDKIIRGYVVEIKGNSFDSVLSRAISLQNILLNGGYKQSAAHLLKRIVMVLTKHKKKEQLDKIITDNIFGAKKLLKANDINLLIDKKNNDKPRILFCSTHWLTGGMERVMSLVFDQLKDTYDIFLITPYDGRAYKIALPDYIKHIKISNSMFYYNFDSAALSVSLILGVDVLVGFYNLLETQLNLYSLCREEGIKTIASNHEYFYYPYINYNLQDVALKRLDAFKDVDAVLWPTNVSAAVCGLSDCNSYLMPNPNTFNDVDAVKNNNEKIIICVGRFNDYIKRIDRILQCFKIVQDRLPNSKLMVVGDCDRQKKNYMYGGKSIDDMIFELGIDESNIIFTGIVSNVGAYYARASVLVLASGSEGFGMVINEAAHFGVPTVYNFIPGVEDLVTNGENGFVVGQGDIKGMADKLVAILSDESLANSLSIAAKRMVKRFDSSVIGRRWIYLIDSLLKYKNPEELKTSLSSELSYSVSDQYEFSKILFSELDKVTRELIESQVSVAKVSERLEALAVMNTQLALETEVVKDNASWAWIVIIIINHSFKKLTSLIRSRGFFVATYVVLKIILRKFISFFRINWPKSAYRLYRSVRFNGLIKTNGILKMKMILKLNNYVI